MKKQCKRRIYKLINPITHAIEGASVTPKDKLNSLRMRELAAIESFRTGTATTQDWSDLASMMNIAESMAMGGIGAEALPTLNEAHQHLIETAKRFKATGRMGFTAPALQCLRDVYEYHDLQRQSVDRSTYERHIARTVNRIKSKSPEVTYALA